MNRGIRYFEDGGDTGSGDTGTAADSGATAAGPAAGTAGSDGPGAPMTTPLPVFPTQQREISRL